METGEKEQNVIVARKDDVTLFTGGDEGDLGCWTFELVKDDKARACKLTEKHRIHLFDCAINTITFNATESYVCIYCYHSYELCNNKYSIM